MKVTKNITIDLNNPRRHVVHLMESGNQREIILTLLKDGMPFDVSDGIGTATLVKGVGYLKANGVPGYYDWTSTDEAAVVAVSGTTNKWTVRLDEHATDVPGFAQIFVKFSLASGETLYSFPITLDVIRTSGGTTDPDKPYYHSSSFLLVGAQAAKTTEMTMPVGVDGDGKLWAEGGQGITDDSKTALLDIVSHIGAWTSGQAQDYYNRLQNAFFPVVGVVSISAVFTQGNNAVYDTDSLNSLKSMVVVTATFSDGTQATIEDYVLSGMLYVGTSTITVTYRGCTTTFAVIVQNIPTGYTLVQFLKSTGTQYIDTGIQYNDQMSYMIAASNYGTITNATQWYIGAYDSANIVGLNTASGATYGNGRNTYIRWGNPNDVMPYFFVNTGASGRAYIFKQHRNIEFVDGVRNDINHEAQTFSISYPMYLFARNNNGTADNHASFRVFRFKAWDSNDALIADFVPCLDDNNVACMFDKVTRTTKYNAGTGAFDYGVL